MTLLAYTMLTNSKQLGDPAVIGLIEESNSDLKLQSNQAPMDGGLYGNSIREMFPEELWEQCLSPKESEQAELKKQEQTYVKAYLKTIGRKALIGDYSDFAHTIPSGRGNN